MNVTSNDGTVLRAQLRDKEREKESLQAQIELIRKTRDNLTTMGYEHLEEFGDNINMLKSIWNNVAVDATMIKEHLEASKIGVVSYSPLSPFFNSVLNRESCCSVTKFANLPSFYRSYSSRSGLRMR